MEQSATQFIEYLRDVRQLSPHTLSNYQRDLASLQRYCEEHNRQSAEQLVEAGTETPQPEALPLTLPHAVLCRQPHPSPQSEST